MISATSDSTALTMSAVATFSLAATASRRLRDSASAGKASSASNAAVSRRPWPSSWGRSTPGEALLASRTGAVARAGALAARSARAPRAAAPVARPETVRAGLAVAPREEAAGLVEARPALAEALREPRRPAVPVDRSVDFGAAFDAFGADAFVGVAALVARCFGFRAVAGMQLDTHVNSPPSRAGGAHLGVLSAAAAQQLRAWDQSGASARSIRASVSCARAARRSRRSPARRSFRRSPRAAAGRPRAA